ncbi:MAG: PEP-CTERM sorting domain-containing protein, partial [Methylohalobius sp.]|nr:PEP-CTERM sorting domain-containing protein [Methylohalobius sp.]
FDITFGSDALALIDFDAGGTGSFANEPSPNTVLASEGEVKNIFINVPSGFSGELSFYYAGVGLAVNIYDATGGTGNLLASTTLDHSGLTCSGDPNPDPAYCWKFAAIPFSGLAKSVGFIGGSGIFGWDVDLDNITLGAREPGGVPEPATLSLLGLGLAGLAWRRKFSA